MHLGLISATSPFRQWMYRSGPQRNKKEPASICDVYRKGRWLPQTFIGFHCADLLMCVKRWMASETGFITHILWEEERERESETERDKSSRRQGWRWSSFARFNNVIVGEKWEPFILFSASISQCHREAFFQMGVLNKAMVTQWKTFLLIRIERSY